jgi:hypothetical protein
MLGFEPSDNSLHDCTTHEVRLASYPEPFAVDTECLRLPLIQPESQRCRPLDPFFTYRSASQNRCEFCTKIDGSAIQWPSEITDLSTTKKQAGIKTLACCMLYY